MRPILAAHGLAWEGPMGMASGPSVHLTGQPGRRCRDRQEAHSAAGLVAPDPPEPLPWTVMPVFLPHFGFFLKWLELSPSADKGSGRSPPPPLLPQLPSGSLALHLVPCCLLCPLPPAAPCWHGADPSRS